MVRFLGLTPLRLHYKLERVGPKSSAVPTTPPVGTASAEPVYGLQSQERAPRSGTE
jgi:hypothetical protein